MNKITEALSRCDKDAIDPIIASLIEKEPEPLVQPRWPAMAATSPPPSIPVTPSYIETQPPASSARTGIRTCALHLPAFAPLMPFGEADWAAGEQYRIARTRIVQHPRKPRLMVISSPAPGDGKTITAINLAGALSLKSEGKVLLADGDFRRSSIHTLLGLPEAPGLADVLRGTCALEEALIQVEQCPNLYVLTAGEARSNPAELLDSTRWSHLAATLRDSFQYTIIDSPAIGVVADYDLIQASCDGVILVLRPDHTKRALAFKAVDSVPKEKLVGVMLNCVRDRFFHKHHSSHYYLPMATADRIGGQKNAPRGMAEDLSRRSMPAGEANVSQRKATTVEIGNPSESARPEPGY